MLNNVFKLYNARLVSCRIMKLIRMDWRGSFVTANKLVGYGDDVILQQNLDHIMKGGRIKE